MKKTMFITSLFLMLCLVSNSSNAQTKSEKKDVPKRCLAQGSLILLEDNKTKTVESLKEGDIIKTYNPITQQYVLKPVMKLHKVASLQTFHVVLENRSSLQLTADHPLLSLDGWKSMRPDDTKEHGYTEVKALNDGDELLFFNKDEISSIKVIKIIPETKYYDTYTIELDGDEVIIANGFLVGQE